MTALASYSTGTVSVAAGGTTVTGVGANWSGDNAKPGDILQIGNFQTVISDVVDATHLAIPPWGGGAQAGAAYKIFQVSPQRFAGAEAMATVNRLVIALNAREIPVVVSDDETAPDPSIGEEDQTAIQPSTGKVWVMSGGVWTFVGIYRGFNPRGAYNGAMVYSVGDVVTDAGTSYIWINTTPGSGHAPPNATYWQILASKGDPGATGAKGDASGIKLTYSSTTADADPGAGLFRLNHATPASATAVYIDNTQVGGASITAILDTWDDSTGTTKGYVRFEKAADPTVWAQFRMTGAVVDGTGYRKLTLANGAGSGAFTAGDGFVASFSRAGDSGAGDVTAANNGSEFTAATFAANLGLLRYAAAQTLTAAQQAQARANLNVQKKNYLLNGGMMVSQENGTTAGTTSGYYPVDQWTDSFVNGGSINFAQVASATPGGSPNRIRMTVTAADASVASSDYCVIAQRVEGYRVADLKFGSALAKAITVQFGVKAPQGTYCVALRNAAPDRIITAEYTISALEANTDVIKSVTFAGDTSGSWGSGNGVGFELLFVLMAGSSFQQSPNAWTAGAAGFATSNQFNLLGTNGNVFELFDAGLYEGAAAPAFQVPDYDDELRKCQRYYYKLTSDQQGAPVGNACGNGSAAAWFTWIFPETMRASPSCTGTGSGAFRINGPGTVAISSFSFNGMSPQMVRGIANVSSGLSNGTAYIVEIATTGTRGDLVANARL